MSDAPQGPDWWQASDNRWYPPPRPTPPDETASPQSGGGESASQQDPTILDGDPTVAVPTSIPLGGLADPTVQQFDPQPDPTMVQPLAPPTAAAPVAPAPPTYPTYPPPGQVAAPYAPPTAPVPSGQSVPPAASPPYGTFPPSGQGMPPSGRPPASPNRTPLLITVAIVAVVALIGVLVVVAGGDDGETTSSSTTTTTGGGDSTDTTDTSDTTDSTDTTDTTTGGAEPSEVPYPSGHEDLIITDQGFSMSPDEATGRDTVSYGALIENTGDRVAVICSIAVSLSDDAGTQIAFHDTAWLSAVLPGQTFGVGFSGLDVRGEPTGMEVVLDSITWDDPANYGEITVEVGDTSLDSYGRPTTTYTAESSYEDELSGPFAWVVHRANDGTIVGGDGAYLDEPLVPGEPVDDEVTTSGPIVEADEGQAEVWIEPVTTDCQPPQPGEPDEAGEL